MENIYARFMMNEAYMKLYLAMMVTGFPCYNFYIKKMYPKTYN